MRNGFIFDCDLCVNCKACSAACILENSFNVKPRSVITFNSEISAIFPVLNLSIACNHCEIPVCMNGCPSSAYFRESSSGAVIVDDKKCIGCRYCIWNCPYDAPKFDPDKRVIGKCHLCYSRTGSGIMPACADACPTGALRFGDIEDIKNEIKPFWYPKRELNPASKITGRSIDIPLKIVPASSFREIMSNAMKVRKSIESESSLVLFSFLTAISVSLMSSSIIKGVLPGKVLFISLTLVPGLFSVFHLGKWTRGWRAVANIKSSPLSREILLYLIYILISCYSIIYEVPWLMISSAAVGFLLLLAIDSVYIYSVRSISVFMHTGQTFLTSLLIISFLAGSIIPYLFIAIIKISLSAYSFVSVPGDQKYSALRFARIAFLIIAGASFVSGISYPEPAVIAIFIAGELLDRILFYLDFEPLGFDMLINNHKASGKHEKERD